MKVCLAHRGKYAFINDAFVLLQVLHDIKFMNYCDTNYYINTDQVKCLKVFIHIDIKLPANFSIAVS